MLSLENAAFTLTFRPEHGAFDLHPRGWERPAFEGARINVRYRLGGQAFERLAERWPDATLTQETVYSPRHGRMETLAFAGVDEDGLSLCVHFALPAQHPLALWKIRLENEGSRPVLLDRITLLEAGEALNGGRLRLPGSGRADPAWYSHGWQSWNWSATYAADLPSRRTRLGLLEAPMYICDGTPQPSRPGHYSGDFFGALVDRGARRGLLAGFLAQQQHFGSLEAWLEDRLALRAWANGDGARIDPGTVVESDWFAVQAFDLDVPQPLDAYLDAAARENEVRPPSARDVPAGWCSWYYYYQAVTEAAVQQNLAVVAQMRQRLALDLVQIDDGFEAQVGDWFLFDPAFPRGVAPLAREIKNQGLVPGLWLAPFIVHPGSKLAAQHPEWLLRDARGRLVSSGFNWNAITSALDLTIPGALEYACAVVDHAAHDWGFPYLKLDFLYAGGLRGAYNDPCRSRAQVLRRGLEALRAAAGAETTLLGCGVPLGPALGLFEAMRIGADVAGSWQPRYLGTSLFFGAEPHMPALRNAIQNTLTRAPMHGRWWVNDPDCLLVRPDTRLTLAEVQSLATAIAMTGGSLLVSDDLPALPEERLRIVEVLLPALGQRPRVLDLFDRETPARLRLDLEGPTGVWSLLALFNWDDTPHTLELCAADVGLPDAAYRVRSFWDGRVLDLPAGAALDLGVIAPHGCALLALRPAQPGPQYLGSDMHFSQGTEVAEWQADSVSVRLALSLPAARQGYVVLWLPCAPRSATFEGAAVAWRRECPDVYAFPVHGQGVLQVW